MRTAALFLCCFALRGQTFDLRQMDFHLHSGMERPVDLDSWIDMAVKDGRRIAVLVDHLELYRKTPQDYARWRTDRKFQAEYPVGMAGHRALFSDFDQAAMRKDIALFKGWEVYEGELDTGVEDAALSMVDMIGWHISPNNGRTAPDGKHLIQRARQVKELQKRFPVPMVLFHPFTMRLENLQRTAKAAGRDTASLSLEDYRFFQAGEQGALARVLQGTSIYIEVSHSTLHYFKDPVTRAALIADIKPLADLGVRFSVSTDAHGLKDAAESFHPEEYCAALGVTAANTNGIARDLLARRRREH